MDAKLSIFIVTAGLFFILLLVIQDSLNDILIELKNLNGYLQIDLRMDQ
jgi:hypothetical protein